MKRLLLVCLFMLSGCAGQDLPSDDIQPLILARTPGLASYNEVFLTCQQPGAPVVIREVLPGESDPQAALALQWGEGEDLPAFVYRVAEDQLAVITHAENPVEMLDLAQIRALFSGQIQSWEALGGDGDVVLWSLTDFHEGAAIFEAGVMDGRPINGGAFLAPDPAALLAEVSANPQAVGYLPFSWVSGDVHVVQTGINQPVLAFSQNAPEGAATAWLACMQGN